MTPPPQATDVRVKTSLTTSGYQVSRVAEMPDFWPWVKGRRVRRMWLGMLPVRYVGDDQTPRRASHG